MNFKKTILLLGLMSVSLGTVAQQREIFSNPVINADYPDPDIIRVGEDFYMVSSSFVAMPGIPICHSKDLINWRIIGHAYDSITFRPQYSFPLRKPLLYLFQD